ncbi:MAG: amidohydrolase [Burkholderiales bacterium]|nr:amidohydrolase [Burkholderiales bacterium]
MKLKVPASRVTESIDTMNREMNAIGRYIACISGLKRWRGTGDQIANEEVHQIVQQSPNRFVGIGAIDASDRREALAGVDRCIREFGFKAIVMEPGNHQERMYADDRRLYPVYSKCADLKIPVFLVIGGNGGPDVSYSDPVHIEQVAIDIPELQIVVVHAAWPWVSQMIRVMLRRPNVFIAPDMYIAYPGSEMFIQAINANLVDQYLYSTAYPFAPVGAFYEKFKGLGIREDLMDNVMFKNAEKLLKLDSAIWSE